eukprot:2274633-Pyramimonas_sp.AAC.1
MTSTGTQYLGALLSGDYQLLWVATPADWHARLPGKRAGPHCQRIQSNVKGSGSTHDFCPCGATR